MRREIALDGECFPVVEAGSGPPLLFLHGAPGDHRTWAPHFRLLEHRFRCIAYTQRGFGASPWRSDGPPLGTLTHAADLAALLQAIEAAPVSLVAWSYSAHVAFQAALESPDLFARILVYEPGVPTYVTDPAALRAWSEDAALMFGPVAEAVAAGDEAEAVRRLIDASGGAGAFDRQAAERRAIHLDGASVMPLLMGGGEPPARIGCAELAESRAPITVAWGAQSRPVFTIPSRAAAACLGGSRHIEVAGAGHLWPEEDPAGFAGLVERWAR